MVVNVFIEIEKHSNLKYEYNHKTKKLELDRVLKYPYFYPYAYGFIPNTLAEDGDELDALIVSDDFNDCFEKGGTYKCVIVGALRMEDEKGVDDKILVVPEGREDFVISEAAKDHVEWFFKNYKKTEVGKWSTTHGIAGREEAVQIYESSVKRRREIER